MENVIEVFLRNSGLLPFENSSRLGRSTMIPHIPLATGSESERRRDCLGKPSWRESSNEQTQSTQNEWGEFSAMNQQIHSNLVNNHFHNGLGNHSHGQRKLEHCCQWTAIVSLCQGKENMGSRMIVL